MEQEKRIAEWCSIAARNDLAALKNAIPEMEAVTPMSEKEWSLMTALFTRLNRPIWTEIMTTRFLLEDPFNISARLENALLFSQSASRQDKAMEVIKDLESLPYNMADDFMKIGTIYANCGDETQAAAWFKRAREREPDNVDIRFRLTWNFLHRGQSKRAISELVGLRPLVAQDIVLMTLLSTLALRVGEKAMATEAYNSAMALLTPEHRGARADLIIQAAHLNRLTDVRRLSQHVSFTHITSMSTFDELYVILESQGLYDVIKHLINAALAIDANHSKFKERARVLNRPRDFLAADGPSITPQPIPPRGLWRQRLFPFFHKTTTIRPD